MGDYTEYAHDLLLQAIEYSIHGRVFVVAESFQIISIVNPSKLAKTNYGIFTIGKVAKFHTVWVCIFSWLCSVDNRRVRIIDSTNVFNVVCCICSHNVVAQVENPPSIASRCKAALSDSSDECIDNAGDVLCGTVRV